MNSLSAENLASIATFAEEYCSCDVLVCENTGHCWHAASNVPVDAGLALTLATKGADILSKHESALSDELRNRQTMRCLRTCKSLNFLNALFRALWDAVGGPGTEMKMVPFGVYVAGGVLYEIVLWRNDRSAREDGDEMQVDISQEHPAGAPRDKGGKHGFSMSIIFRSGKTMISHPMYSERLPAAQLKDTLEGDDIKAFIRNVLNGKLATMKEPRGYNGPAHTFHVYYRRPKHPRGLDREQIFGTLGRRR